MAICIGLDVHTKTSVYKAKDETGCLIDSGSIPSTHRDLTGLARKFPGATVVIEASGVSEWVYDLFADVGLKPVLCHPVNIRRILGKKNDEVDAGFLVDSYQLGCLPLSWVPPKDIRLLRQIARRCAFLSNQRARIKNRVHAILRRRGIKIKDDMTGKPVRDIFVKMHREKLLDIDDAEISEMVDFLEFVEDKRKRADRQCKMAAFHNPNVRLLMSIPGFGPLVSVGIFSEIGDIARFDKAENLCSYFGLVPVESQSGESLIRGHISRRGSSTVRWLITQAAWVHVYNCPDSTIAKKYRRLAKRIGNKRAIIAVCRMLIKVCYHLLREKRYFRPAG
jgi:transposase